MATSRTSLIRRHFRQRFGISAPRVGVRSEVQWYWRILLWIGVLSVSLAAALWIYDAGRRFAGFDRGASERELATLRTEVDQLSDDLARSAEYARSLDGRLQVELSTIEQMGQQLSRLQRENASLKEDLALFEGLVAEPVGASDSIKIAKVKIEPAAVLGRYRFSVLLVRRVGGKGAKEFSGELQFGLKVRRAGVDGMIALPGEGNPAASFYRFTVKHFFRAEGEFSVPADSTLLGGEVKVLQDGVIKLRQPIT